MMKRKKFTILILITILFIMTGCTNKIIMDLDINNYDEVINNIENDNITSHIPEQKPNKPIEKPGNNVIEFPKFSFATKLYDKPVDKLVLSSDKYIIFEDKGANYLLKSNGRIHFLSNNYKYIDIIEDYIIIKDNNKIGVIYNNHVIIPCIYDYIFIKGNTKLCKKGDNYYVYDNNNHVREYNNTKIILIGDNALFINNNLCDINGQKMTISINNTKYNICDLMKNNRQLISKDYKYGFIDNNNNLIHDTNYIMASSFIDGYSIVQKNYNELPIIIDTNFTTVFNCEDLKLLKQDKINSINIINNKYIIIEYVKNYTQYKYLLNLDKKINKLLELNEIDYTKTCEDYIYDSLLHKYYSLEHEKYLNYNYIKKFNNYYFAYDDEYDYILSDKLEILVKNKKLSLNNTFYCYNSDNLWYFYKLN